MAGAIVVTAVAMSGKPAPSPPDPEVSNDTETFTGPNSAEATGTIANLGGQTAESVVVIVSMVDNGKRVASGQQAIGDIKPGARAYYDIRVTVAEASSLSNPAADIEWTWLADHCPRGTVASPAPSGSGRYCLSAGPSAAPSG